MSGQSLNSEMLPGNTCFGCGQENPLGLKVEVYRDPAREDRIRGSFTPREHMTGFPAVTHGGALYTALDCMAFWATVLLRRQAETVWILRSANMKYHRPAPPEQPLALMARIAEQGGEGDPMVIHAEARNTEDLPVAAGEFKVVPLSPEKFKRVAGIDELPAHWVRLLSASRK